MTKSSGSVAFVVPVLLAVGFLMAGLFFVSPGSPEWISADRENVVSENVGSVDSVSKGQSRDDFPSFFFVSYNVRNWLVAGRTPEKSAASKAAVVRLLARAEADVIGLCEIGSPDDLREIQELLAREGIELPYSHHTGGADQVRHLALLSRFPIAEIHRPKALVVSIGGENHSVRRGVLDVTLDIDGTPVRCIGLHFKSKRSVPEFDESVLRLEEAKLARSHIDEILSGEPDARLIVYGDWNDSVRSTSTRTLLGRHNSPGYLTLVPLEDSRGETWTHFWKLHDAYSRIDFVATSRVLRSRVDRENSRIIDPADWEKASDHRALLVRFR